MRHAYRSGAVADTPPASGASSTGFPADDTVPGARWYHAISAEIINTIVAGGLTPDGATLTQLRQAVEALIEAAVDDLVIPPGTSLATIAEHLQNNPPSDEAATPAGLRAMLAAVDRVELATKAEHLQNNPPSDEAATPEGLRCMLDDLFGSANRREFTTAGAHSYTWEWNTPNGLAIFVAGEGRAFARQSNLDITLDAGFWSGAFSDGTTVWFLDPQALAARAYTAASGARDAGRDITSIGGSPTGAVSDGTTVWFVGPATVFASAHTLATGAADSSRDINIGSGTWNAATTDGMTLWFVDSGAGVARAYTLASRVRAASRDISLPGTGGTWGLAASDGQSVWFGNQNTGVMAAYTAATSARNAALDLIAPPGGGGATVSAGSRLWMVSAAADVARVFQAPATGEGTSVEVDGVTYDVDGGAQRAAFDRVALTGLTTSTNFSISVGSGVSPGRVILVPLF